MINREIELVKMTHQEALSYVPPAGIDVDYLEWQDEKGKKLEDPKQIIPFAKQVVMEFLCSDLQPDPILRKSLKDIHHELMTSDYFRDRVLRRDLGSHAKSPKKGMMVEVNLANPMIGEAPPEVKRAAEEATDVHDVLYTPQEIEQDAFVESSFEFDKYSGPGYGGNGRYTRKLKFREPDEVVQERFYRHEGPDQQLVEDYGPERYKYKLGVIDIG
jgi:hypothetical protein